MPRLMRVLAQGAHTKVITVLIIPSSRNAPQPCAYCRQRITGALRQQPPVASEGGRASIPTQAHPNRGRCTPQPLFGK